LTTGVEIKAAFNVGRRIASLVLRWIGMKISEGTIDAAKVE
jgi:hypothetical protein